MQVVEKGAGGTGIYVVCAIQAKVSTKDVDGVFTMAGMDGGFN